MNTVEMTKEDSILRQIHEIEDSVCEGCTQSERLDARRRVKALIEKLKPINKALYDDLWSARDSIR